MNRKILTLAIVAIAVMGFSITATAMSAETDGAVTKAPTAGQDDLGSALPLTVIPSNNAISVGIDISYPSGDGTYFNIPTWFYKTGATSYATVPSDVSTVTVCDAGSTTKELTKLNVTKGDPDIYHFTVSATASSFSPGDSFVLAFQLITSNTNGTYQSLSDANVIFEQYLYYKITVAAALPDAGTLKFDDASVTPGFSGGNTIAVSYNTGIDFNLAAELKTPSKVTDGVWFAEDLPDGLSMTPNGHIVGKTIAAANQYAVKVTLGAPGLNGAAPTYYHGSITIDLSGTASTVTITPAVTDPGMKDMGVVTVNGTSVDRYATVLTAADNNAPLKFNFTIEGSALENFALSMINTSDGTSKSLDYSVSESTGIVDTTIAKGTGEFLIDITNGTTTKTLLCVVVIDAVDDVRAGIAFNIGTTA